MSKNKVACCTYNTMAMAKGTEELVKRSLDQLRLNRDPFVLGALVPRSGTPRPQHQSQRCRILRRIGAVIYGAVVRGVLNRRSFSLR